MDSPDPETITADQAYATSDGHTFQGQPLHAFSVRRQYAAQALGNKLLCGTAALTGGAYEGMFLDVAVLLHLCLTGPAESMFALRNGEKVIERALDWAETAGLSVGSPAFKEASAIYGTILKELMAAQFTIVEKDADEGTPKKNV